MTLDESLTKALASIKRSALGGKYIKVELEAVFGRHNSRANCGAVNCDNGFQRGTETTRQDDCEYDCDPLDLTYYDSDEDEYNDCPQCSTRPLCTNCSGNSRTSWEISDCQRWISDNMSPEIRSAITYQQVMSDGSVDTEWTVTVPLNKVRILPDIIRLWTRLGEVIGNGTSTRGAGMHIGILNSSRGTYPSGNSLDSDCITNLQNSMQALMPALFFLGSPNQKSRSLGYRAPRVSGSKHSAINFGHNMLEYRVFEPCYDKPEAILDMVCVIAKTLQFYTKRRKKIEFQGKYGQLVFQEAGDLLERFYATTRHLDALNAGLQILKPDHKTIDQLKKERGFKITKTELVNKEKNLASTATKEYAELSARKRKIADKAQQFAQEMYDHDLQLYEANPNYYQAPADLEYYIRNVIARLGGLPDSLDGYIQSKLTPAKGHVVNV